MAAVKAWLQRQLHATFEASSTEHRSYLVYGNLFFLKAALLLCVAAIVLYVVQDPQHGPSGNTWAGYTLGTLGALIIGWLAWFGVRKRNYREGRGAAQAWASAHVYLGLSLLVVATLHTGFQFGWNVHTLAYVLMVGVIASGIYGIIVYATLPRRITANRGPMGLEAMLGEIAKLDESALALADRIDADTHAVVARSVGKARVGGSFWQQLTGRYRPMGERLDLEGFFKLKRTEIANTPAAPSSGKPGAGARGGRQATIQFVAAQIFDAGRNPRAETLQKLLQTIAQRKALVERVNRDITLRARLNVWLYLHVPLTVALLAGLVAHVITVFFYW